MELYHAFSKNTSYMKYVSISVFIMVLGLVHVKRYCGIKRLHMLFLVNLLFVIMSLCYYAIHQHNSCMVRIYSCHICIKYHLHLLCLLSLNWTNVPSSIMLIFNMLALFFGCKHGNIFKTNYLSSFTCFISQNLQKTSATLTCQSHW